MIKKWIALSVVVVGAAFAEHAFAGSVLGIDEVTSLRSTDHNTLSAESPKEEAVVDTKTLVKVNGKVIGQYDSSLITINENVVNRKYHLVKGNTAETAYTYHLKPFQPKDSSEKVAAEDY